MKRITVIFQLVFLFSFSSMVLHCKPQKDNQTNETKGNTNQLKAGAFDFPEPTGGAAYLLCDNQVILKAYTDRGEEEGDEPIGFEETGVAKGVWAIENGQLVIKKQKKCFFKKRSTMAVGKFISKEKKCIDVKTPETVASVKNILEPKPKDLEGEPTRYQALKYNVPECDNYQVETFEQYKGLNKEISSLLAPN